MDDPLKEPMERSAPVSRTKGPLVAVVERGERVDVLACGHVLSAASDIYGPRYPDRRRCWKCRAGRPADIQGAATVSSDGPVAAGGATPDPAERHERISGASVYCSCGNGWPCLEGTTPR